MPRDVESTQDSKQQQFAALPLMKCGDETLVLLITSWQTRRWVLPRGWAETGLTPMRAVLNKGHPVPSMSWALLQNFGLRTRRQNLNA